MKKYISLKIFLSVYTILIFNTCYIFAQDIPEEAQKHLARGQAAMEIAKVLEDYNLAVSEFKQAIQIAPTCGEPHYQLGLTYDKMEKYTDAIASLKKYVELSPTAENVSEVKSLIYKIEFKAEQVAEQVLTVSYVIDLLCSAEFKNWKKSGDDIRYPYYIYGGCKKIGENSIEIPRIWSSEKIEYSSDQIWQVRKDMSIAFTTDVHRYFNEAYSLIQTENYIEVLSKKHVKYTQYCTPINHKGEAMVHLNSERTCEFKK